MFSKGSVGVNEYSIRAVIGKKYGNALNALTLDGEEEALTLRAESNIYLSGIDPSLRTGTAHRRLWKQSNPLNYLS